MPHVDINGNPIHYQQSGEGPDVVLLHGFTGNLAIWMFIDIVDTLASDFRVTCYDLRGHGNSGVPPRGYTSADMADDLTKLHEKLGLEPAYMVGHSLGGVVATHAAVLHPEMVRGLILSDTYFPGLRHIEPEMGHSDVWKELRLVLLRADAEIGETVDFNRLFHVVRELTPGQFESVRKHLGATGTRWLLQLTKLGDTTAAEDIFCEAGLTAEKISTVSQPLVALYDEHSPFTATAQFLESNLSSCRLDTVPGAEHLAFLQNSTAFVALVQKHLCDMAGVEDSQYTFRRCKDCEQANLLKEGRTICCVCGADLSGDESEMVNVPDPSA